MGKIVSMTAKEIRKTYGKDEAAIMAMAKAAPCFDGDPNPGGKPIARGLDRPKPKTQENVVVIRLPQNVIAGLRATGRGWQTRASNYLMEGFKKGKLAVSANRTV
jgi:uncharacterized protein (DUF4415 family)